ncbi:MAG: hypothetical protein ACXQS5_00235 [Candidatus Methanospirareceae archaeon]
MVRYEEEIISVPLFVIKYIITDLQQRRKERQRKIWGCFRTMKKLKKDFFT